MRPHTPQSMHAARCVSACAMSALVVLTACRAPRDNPLDPSLGGNIDGRVLTRSAAGIAGVEVLVPAADRACTSDSTGRFSFRGLPEESLWVYFSGNGWATDSACIVTERGRIDTVNRYLNGLPQLAGCWLTTHVYGRSWPPEPLVFCRLSARAADPDGESDVDSVWTEIPALGFSKRLSFNPDSGKFLHTLWATALPSQSLETMVGMAARFVVADARDSTSRTLDPCVSRIIYQPPQLVFPAGGLDTVATETTFVWASFDRGYWVRYHNEVVRIEAGQPAGVAARFDTPGPTDTTYQFDPEALAPGDYYWTVEAIDLFGNSSRSTEELFHAR